MKKILFPTDFSPTAENAFHYALALADAMDAKVDVMTIYQLPFADFSNVPANMIEEMIQQQEASANEKLVLLKGGYMGGYPERIGDMRAVYSIFVAEEVAEVAEDEEYDLIVMGTRGEHNVLEKIMGSITTQTMMNARCPVLAVPEAAQFRPVSVIAYATDFVPSDAEAVNTLVDFAKAMDAEVHFVHVDTKGGDKAGEIETQHRFFANMDFSVVNSPSVIEGVQRYIQEYDAQILALCSPRRSVWERLFHSSFTKRMTFHSDIPVLVFRE